MMIIIMNIIVIIVIIIMKIIIITILTLPDWPQTCCTDCCCTACLPLTCRFMRVFVQLRPAERGAGFVLCGYRTKTNANETSFNEIRCSSRCYLPPNFDFFEVFRFREKHKYVKTGLLQSTINVKSSDGICFNFHGLHEGCAVRPDHCRFFLSCQLQVCRATMTSHAMFLRTVSFFQKTTRLLFVFMR